MKRIILAAEQSDLYADRIKSLSEDVDYALDGFDALARRGKDGEAEAIELMNQFGAQVAEITAAIAAKLA